MNTLRSEINSRTMMRENLVFAVFLILLYLRFTHVLQIQTAIISRDVLIIMIKRRIREELLVLTNQKSALSLSEERNVQTVMDVKNLIIESRSFIILINIKRNFVHPILTTLENVNMVSIAHLHIQPLKSQQSLQTNLSKIQISICFILKQFGVLIMKQIIKETNVYFHIIGKTSEENLSFIITPRINATNGVLDHSSITIEMAAPMNIIAITVMVGKSKSIILKITN